MDKQFLRLAVETLESGEKIKQTLFKNLFDKENLSMAS